MTAKELSDELGIGREGVEENGTYVIELEDSDDYARVYTLLDSAENLELFTDNMLLSDSASLFTYESDDFDIDLVANLDNNIYKVIFKSKGNENNESEKISIED